jgi:polyisoprenyl-phosphate glycosyltransferase
VPCFNEAENVQAAYQRISAAAEKCGVAWELLFVDDGSRDQTEELLAEISQRDPRVKVISFSRNFGHQAALTAGMILAIGDAVIMLDGDLQHPPELIPTFFQKWLDGAKVVQGIRRSSVRSIGKALTSRLFYTWLNRFTEVEVEPNAADYRLLDRRVVDYLNSMPERGRFLRGQLAWLGFPLTRIEYDEEERHAGTPKYTLSKMMNLAKDAVTSSSLKPLYLSTWLGFVLMLGALGYGAYGLAAKVLGRTTPGWTSLMLAILSIGSIELLVLSIHGVYIGQLSKEQRSRPLFCIARTHGMSAEIKPDRSRGAHEILPG